MEDARADLAPRPEETARKSHAKKKTSQPHQEWTEKEVSRAIYKTRLPSRSTPNLHNEFRREHAPPVPLVPTRYQQEMQTQSNINPLHSVTRTTPNASLGQAQLPVSSSAPTSELHQTQHSPSEPGRSKRRFNFHIPFLRTRKSFMADPPNDPRTPARVPNARLGAGFSSPHVPDTALVMDPLHPSPSDRMMPSGDGRQPLSEGLASAYDAQASEQGKQEGLLSVTPTRKAEENRGPLETNAAAKEANPSSRPSNTGTGSAHERLNKSTSALASKAEPSVFERAGLPDPLRCHPVDGPDWSPMETRKFPRLSGRLTPLNIPAYTGGHGAQPTNFSRPIPQITYSEFSEDSHGSPNVIFESRVPLHDLNSGRAERDEGQETETLSTSCAHGLSLPYVRSLTGEPTKAVHMDPASNILLESQTTGLQQVPLSTTRAASEEGAEKKANMEQSAPQSPIASAKTDVSVPEPQTASVKPRTAVASKSQADRGPIITISKAKGQGKLPRVIIINTAPKHGEFLAENSECGPSLARLDETVKGLLASNEERGDDQFRRVHKLVINGHWDTTYDCVSGAHAEATATASFSKGGNKGVKKTPKSKGKKQKNKKGKGKAKASQDVDTSQIEITEGSVKGDNGKAKAPQDMNTSPTDMAEGCVKGDITSPQGEASPEGTLGAEDLQEKIKKEELLAIGLIVQITSEMTELQEFEWTTHLTFSKEILTSLSTKTITSLSINLFRPGKKDKGSDDETIPMEDLHHLREFKNLRQLALFGMEDSYQKIIWETAWSLPGLQKLDLRMVLEPNVRSNHAHDWPFIQGSWKMKKMNEVSMSYHGDKGSGTLHFRCGYGEYLDPISMLRAKNAVLPGQPDARLGIEELVLAGFVVDSQPFQKCFDMTKLKKIEFAHDCIDAGFSLSSKQCKKTEIVVPTGKPPTFMEAVMHKLKDLKIVTLSKGQVIKRESYWGLNTDGGSERLADVVEAEKKETGSTGD